METKKVISIVKQIPTSGHSPHRVIADDYDEYILKIPNNAADVISIQKEVICSALLKVWELETPTACFLTLVQGLREEINKTVHGNFFFGSNFINNAIDTNHLFRLEKKVNRKLVSNLNDLLKIALFDIWVANDDRKPTNNNLLFCPSGSNYQINAIDHAYNFATIKFSQLNNNDSYFSINDSILYTPIGKQAIKEAKVTTELINHFREIFYICLGNSEKRLDEILALFPQELQLTERDAISLRNFIFNEARNKLVFELFCSILLDLKK